MIFFKKHHIHHFLLISTLYLLQPSILFADAQTHARLTEIYALYNTDVEASCRQIEELLEGLDNLDVGDEKIREAYYFLANCQYSLKKFDEAIVYYEKIASIYPEEYQSLMDAGSVYLQLGDYGQSWASYEKALARVKGNKGQEDNIKSVMKNIPGRLRKDFSISTGIAFDSNVNTGPSDTNHFVFDSLNFTLQNDDKPREDFAYQNNLSAAFTKAIDPKTVLLFNASVNNTGYFTEDDFNTAYFSTSFGYRKVFGTKSVTISPTLNYQTLDDKSYQVIAGINALGAIKVSDKSYFWPYLGWYHQDYYTDGSRDAQGITSGISTWYALSNKTSLIASLYYTYNAARDDRFTYNNLFLGASVSQSFTKRLNASLGYNLQLFYYDDPEPAFGTSREDDGHRVYVNVDYVLDKFFENRKPTLNLNVSYNQNNSNHSFQENDRVFTALKLIFNF